MGIYLNPENVDFQEVLNSKIYVDKSELIQYTNSVLRTTQKYICVSRPRRFGKSMAANMLTAYYSRGCDSGELFQGLKIATHPDFEKHLNRYNVIHLNMRDYLTESENMKQLIQFVEDDLLDELQQEFSDLRMPRRKTLVKVLEQAFAQYKIPFVFIIDEWDCIFRVHKSDAASQKDYLDFLRNLLKDKSYIALAYMTGILPIKKYGEHSAINVFYEYSMTDASPIEEFTGFTEQEVRQLCEQYNMPFSETKKWYDGYRFGNTDIYCPWDVINHCRALKVEPDATPQPYWINTSGNYIVKRFIEKANQQTRREIEQLIEGKAIQKEITSLKDEIDRISTDTEYKEIRLELTYNELDSTIENLWSVLFATGYLTQQGKPQGRTYSLIIPNESIRQIFIEQIQEWFKETTRKDENRLKDFCKAFEEGNAEAIEEQFNNYLMKTISIRDTFTTKKENFYHGVLLGLLSYDPDWYITSNQESGDGYSDIMIEAEQARIGIIIEVKYAENIKTLDKACQKALKQIKEKNYDQKLEEEGYETILNYGIACYKKRCKVLVDK